MCVFISAQIEATSSMFGLPCGVQLARSLEHACHYDVAKLHNVAHYDCSKMFDKVDVLLVKRNTYSGLLLFRLVTMRININ